MRFLLSEHFWVLDSLYPTEWEWLRELPRIASGEDFTAASRERLYPPPLSDDTLADESTLAQAEDWDELIRPELEETFASARSIVEKDLSRGERFEPDPPDPDDLESDFADAGIPFVLPEFYRIVIPNENSEAWYSTLNQARLLLNEEHDLAASEDRHLAKMLGPEAVDQDRLLLIARYELYSVIQSILVENLMSD